jgi:hypothetical protein
LPDPLVEGGISEHLAQHLPRQAERLSLFGRDRPAEPATQLLQPVIVGLSELFRANLGSPDFGEPGSAETAEDVPDPPNAETDHEKTEHPGHDNSAEEMGRRFVKTSKHGPKLSQLAKGVGQALLAAQRRAS